MISDLFGLLILFQCKHFIADYPLQGRYMLGKFKTGTAWIMPLVCHAMVHNLFTFIICLGYLLYRAPGPNLQWGILCLCLAWGDFIIHFVVDRIKASPNMLGRFEIKDPRFWWALGADQMAHHLTHYFIIFALITAVY